VLALWLSSGVRAAVVFGSIVNWPPYDKTDLSRCSPLWVQLAARLVGLFNSETSGPFQGLDRAVPLNITTENGMVCGLRLSPTSEKATTVVYLHGQAGNVVVQHRTELYKLLASRLGCEVIAIDYCSCGYSDFCRPSEASVVADVRAVLQSLPQAERDKVILWGHSLGTGIALVSVEALLKEGFHFGGVVLEAPFLSLAAAAGSLLEAALHRPWPRLRQGVEAWVRGWHGLQFNSAGRIREVAAGTNVLILHGTKDWKVPHSHGRELSEIGNVPLHSFPCGHNDIIQHRDLLPLLKAVFTKW